ncbi:proteasome activator [Nonomuraea sp. NPDC048892]|uniref:proteasome activator n=1 Tax=Nonomuraea sp. NPDC048892 TaxID=3154624 RepID=UPI003409104E
MTSAPVPGPPDRPGGPARPADAREAAQAELGRVKEPARLLRVSTMARSLLDEARGLSLDEHARDQLRHIHARVVEEIGEAVAPELRDELERLLPPSSEVLSQAEIRIAQSQLVGWLEGVFQGIKIGLSFQQLAGPPPTGPQDRPPAGPGAGPYL